MKEKGHKKMRLSKLIYSNTDDLCPHCGRMPDEDMDGNVLAACEHLVERRSRIYGTVHTLNPQLPATHYSKLRTVMDFAYYLWAGPEYDPDQWWGVGQVAKRYKIYPPEVYGAIGQGSVKAERVHGYWRLSRNGAESLWGRSQPVEVAPLWAEVTPLWALEFNRRGRLRRVWEVTPQEARHLVNADPLFVTAIIFGSENKIDIYKNAERPNPRWLLWDDAINAATDLLLAEE